MTDDATRYSETENKKCQQVCEKQNVNTDQKSNFVSNYEQLESKPLELEKPKISGLLTLIVLSEKQLNCDQVLKCLNFRIEKIKRFSPFLKPVYTKKTKGKDLQKEINKVKVMLEKKENQGDVEKVMNDAMCQQFIVNLV